VPLGGRRLRRGRELHGVERVVSGERVRIVGNRLSLGRWRVRRGRELQRIERDLSDGRVRVVGDGVPELGRRL
jgi:hypothetical protein